jgi:hypothetical protein
VIRLPLWQLRQRDCQIGIVYFSQKTQEQSIDTPIFYDRMKQSPTRNTAMETLLFHLLLNYADTVCQIDMMPHTNVAELNQKAKAIQQLTIDTAQSLNRAMHDIKTAGRTLAVTPSRN